MNRREFIRKAAGAGAAARFRLQLARGADSRGKLFVFVQAAGGWDPTSFCDPKANTPGELPINHWAEQAEIRRAGNIAYAPWDSNEAFFEKYYRRMLVVNGVDAQTDSHDAGVIHNWSGRIAEGYPTTTALLAAHYGAGLPMPYLSFGGYSNPAGLAVYTRLDDAQAIRGIVAPETGAYADGDPYIKAEDLQALRAFREAGAARLAAAPNLLPRAAAGRGAYLAAVSPEAAEGLREFAATMPTEDRLERVEEFGEFTSALRRQAQLAVLAFKSGAAIGADLFLDGFDTHENHDRDHVRLLANLTESVDFLWDYAEIHGLADRLVVVIGSDFGRTNFYNDNRGKDHWPIGSFIVMEKNQPWTNRVVGETDDLHFARRIDPATLRRDDANGILLQPKHVHKALRRYLGVADSPGSLQFPFHGAESLALFG